jgi:serine/threonine protein kinase
MRPIYSNKASLLDIDEGDEIQLPSGPYRVDGTVSGGMGKVILISAIGREFRFGRPTKLALKLCRGGIAKEKVFFEELSKWALLFHEGIAPLKEIFWSESDGYVAASARYEGSLRDLLRKQNIFNSEVAYYIVRVIADALHYGHEQFGILHLDVKPENILFNKFDSSSLEPQVAVTDWGISTVKRALMAVNKFDNSNNAGTLPYMAPERLLAGSPSSPRSDIYGLGMLWLELRTGDLPFCTEESLVKQIASGRYHQRAAALLKGKNVDRETSRRILELIHPVSNQGVSGWRRFMKLVKPTFLEYWSR